MNQLNCNILEQFFGCYFHQDFRDDYGSPEGAIEAFINEQPENIGNMIVALDELKKMNFNEEDLRDKLISLGSDYGPWLVNKYTAIEWVGVIYGMVASAAHS